MSAVEALNNPEKSALIRRFESLIAPKSDAELEAMAAESCTLTAKHFGKAIRLFAPLYLSNECVNACKYCGFSRHNPILRVTLTIEEVLREVSHLTAEGFRDILLVASEHPKHASAEYLELCVKTLAAEIPRISLEVGPMGTEDYARLVKAGAEGLTVFQETYHRPTYAEVHPSGPKRDFDYRLACPERAYQGGFRRIGIGVLHGLWEWREESISLARHLEYLLKHCWKAAITVSLPRLRPAASGFRPAFPLPDREFVQLVCALRICFPQVGLVLSTRESAALRDGLIPLGITTISAGSHTEPGGYTGQGKETLHQTVGGEQIPLTDPATDSLATEQFHVADERSAADIAAMLRQKGFEPVWKDWDKAILATS